ncbi:MAG: hypothetical protein M3Z85_15900 [Acidobacteriota bacterium]|nr:hypothetical protein [Acidobacteriota bacterium]
MPRALAYVLSPETSGLIIVGSAIAIAAGLGFRSHIRNRPDAAELEARRRRGVNSWGKMGDGIIVELHENVIEYSYHVRGVGYTASQDLTTLQAYLPEDRWSVVGPVSVKYDPRNPANSIVLCERWSGLRKVR